MRTDESSGIVDLLAALFAGGFISPSSAEIPKAPFKKSKVADQWVAPNAMQTAKRTIQSEPKQPIMWDISSLELERWSQRLLQLNPVTSGRLHSLMPLGSGLSWIESMEYSVVRPFG